MRIRHPINRIFKFLFSVPASKTQQNYQSWIKIQSCLQIILPYQGLISRILSCP